MFNIGLGRKPAIDGSKCDNTDDANDNDDGALNVNIRQVSRGSREDERLTYISVLVTGVPTRNRAKRKLKTSEVEPSGATYSGPCVKTR